jgi:hypothetical protein
MRHIRVPSANSRFEGIPIITAAQTEPARPDGPPARPEELVSMMPLWRGWPGLKRSIPQAEGVTTDAQGALYIVSEPNLFYRFEPSQDAADG